MKLVGDGVTQLAKEVTQEYRLMQAREIIREGYKTGVVDLDRFPNKEMKKLILGTFLTEFGPDASKGTPPKFVGQGIIKINLELIKEKNLGKATEHTHSEQTELSPPRNP